MKKIEITNFLLIFLSAVTSNLKLDNAESAARRRFGKVLKNYLEALEDSRKDLQKKYYDKSADGEPLMVAGEYQYSLKNKKSLNQAWEALNNEVVVIDVLPSNERDIPVVSGILSKEIARVEELNKDGFNSSDFEYFETLKETVEALIPKEA